MAYRGRSQRDDDAGRHRGVRLVRNPIFTAMVVFAGGVALVTPNAVALVAFALLLVTIELQVRAVEEPYLTRVHGKNYRAYLASVGRFLPGVGLSL